MQLTVEQALSVYPLSEGKLIAGAAGVDRIVKSINVMDAPDIADWIKEGEMLFTTAYLFRDRPQEVLELIRKLNGKRSSGLGIKVGRFWSSIPQEIVKEADELQFPLIELPYPFTFSDQMNGLFQAELKRTTGIMQEVLDKQVRLMRFALHAGHGRTFFDAVADCIGSPMSVIGARGQILYNSSAIPDQELLFDRPWAPHKKRINRPEWHAFRLPLMKQSQCSGFVYFFHPHPILAPAEEGLYAQAAELISYHIHTSYEDYLERSVRKDFGLMIRRYLKNGVSLEMLNEYASRWDLELLMKPYRCVLTSLTLEGPSLLRSERIERIRSDYVGHSRLQEVEALHIAVEEGVLSIIPSTSDEDEAGLEELYLALLSGSGGAGSRARSPSLAKAALSGRKYGPEGLREAFVECGEALRLSDEWGLESQVVSYGSLDLALLFEKVPNSRMLAYCSRWLGPLLVDKSDQAQELLRTLEAYLDCDGQLSETAKKLFVHRNTVTYRVEKLGDMLKVDMKRIDDLLRLKLALLFRRMLNRSGGEGQTWARS